MMNVTATFPPTVSQSVSISYLSPFDPVSFLMFTFVVGKIVAAPLLILYHKQREKAWLFEIGLNPYLSAFAILILAWFAYSVQSPWTWDFAAVGLALCTAESLIRSGYLSPSREVES